jgi:hypothetical protein
MGSELKMMVTAFAKLVVRNGYFVNLFYHRWQLRQNSYMQNYFEVDAA